jgi:hypothetical protein
MDIQKGDHVLVNVAPFIGSLRRNKQSVICEVLVIDGDEVEIRTLPPCRDLTLRVERFWVDCKLEPTGV